ncbi:MAG: hypothetical protein ACQESN_09480 [Thermotogota bacterium]
MKKVNTKRDLTIFKNDEYIVFAMDSCGAIGEKEVDELKFNVYNTAKLTLRVCLNELFSVGATPKAVFSLVANEFDPTAGKILKAIKDELEENDLKDIEINGSSEENFETNMTAFGLNVFSTAKKLKMRNTQPSYYIYLVGKPFVGQEVVDNQAILLKPKMIKYILDNYEVGDFIPCGSGGILKEIEVLSKENSLEYKLYENKVDLKKSAGPATCGIFTTKEKIESIKDYPLTLIGKYI